MEAAAQLFANGKVFKVRFISRSAYRAAWLRRLPGR
jgi:hypothetical protein